MNAILVVEVLHHSLDFLKVSISQSIEYVVLIHGNWDCFLLLVIECDNARKKHSESNLVHNNNNKIRWKNNTKSINFSY